MTSKTVKDGQIWQCSEVKKSTFCNKNVTGDDTISKSLTKKLFFWKMSLTSQQERGSFCCEWSNLYVSQQIAGLISLPDV